MGKQTYKKDFAAALKKLEETYHADVDLVKNTMAEITDAELNNPDYVAMFGQKLKAERKSKNITLDQEANQLGINRTTILDMENNPNRKKVNREYLYAVSLFFQNSPWYFLYGPDWDGQYKDGLAVMTFAPNKFVTEAPYGYVKDPDNKDFWIIDEEAAAVVRLIFRLFIGGKNRNQIAVHLKNEQIPTPTFYMKDRGRGTCKNKLLDLFNGHDNIIGIGDKLAHFKKSSLPLMLQNGRLLGCQNRLRAGLIRHGCLGSDGLAFSRGDGVLFLHLLPPFRLVAQNVRLIFC